MTSNYEISAPLVEKWLALNSASLGIDTSKYTIFLINWYGRGDFRFHVYSKTGENDPDTNMAFGARSSRKMMAWGGTPADDPETGLGSTRRVWFYDLSAGPEYWSDAYNVDDADVDGDKILDYRMPPVWEYGTAKPVYRAFNDLSGDLGKIVRYVALDLLFTTSPLYKPMISPPLVPSKVQLDLNLYQGDPAFDAKTIIKQNFILGKVSALQPVSEFSSSLTTLPFTGHAADVYGCFRADISCYGRRLFGIAFGDLFIYHDSRITGYLEGDADYEIPIFNYNTTAANGVGGLLGFADDNWSNGTQSYVFNFNDPTTRTAGYG